MTKSRLSFIYFLFYCLLVFSVFISKGGIIRIISFVNVLILSALVYQEYLHKKALHLPLIVWVTSIFIGLNMFATHSIAYDNEYTKILFSIFFGIGFYKLISTAEVKEKWLLNGLLVGLIGFVTFQLVSIYGLDKPNGTFKNPHYIALFSTYAAVLSLYYFFSEASNKRLIIFPIVLCLLSFVLASSSRPTWIALTLAAIFAMFFLNSRLRWVTGGLIVAVPSVLFLTNLGNFGRRVSDLALNISREERVIIWSDAWRMQNESSLLQWLVGHGLNSFEADFKLFSRYHQIGNDFTMPHNSILEVLYATGILGLMVFISIYSYMIFQLLKIIPHHPYKKLGLVLLAFIIINLIMSLITIKWFTHLNSYPLAFVLGMLSFMIEKKDKSYD